VRVWTAFDNVRLDAKFGLRQLGRSPLTTFVSVLTLAIGIGVNTAVFSLVYAALLRPLPYPAAERLVWVAPYDDHFRQDTWASRADYLIWRQHDRLFDAMAAYGTQDLTLLTAAEASQERVASVAGDFWTITGARPALGRLFSEPDAQGLVLSYALFERRFGGRASVIGETADVGGALFTITGVLPRDFRMRFPQQVGPGDVARDVDAFIPLPPGIETPGMPIPRGPRPAPPWVSVVGVLRPGVPIERARGEMQALHQRLQRDHPRPAMLQRSLRVLPLTDKLVENGRLILFVLSGAVVFVLLIATANVANLLLAQASTRTREIAIRAAVGARRGRLLAQFLVESLLLALLAGTAGVFVASAAIPILVALAPPALPGIADTSVDGTVLLFTLLVSLATGVLFAWAPVIETWRVSHAGLLGDGARTATRRGTRIDGLLIGVEIALAVVLLAGAGLMMKSLWRLHDYPRGFAPERSYTMRVALSGPRYEAFEQKLAYIDALLGRLEDTPGVEAAGISASTYHLPISIEGRRSAPDEAPLVAVRMVSPDYLRAMGVSLLRGRWPTGEDEFDAMVVNETFARTMAPDADPIGKSIGGSFVSGTIAGIVADFPYSRLDGPPGAELYYPFQRAPATRSIVVAIRMPQSTAPVVRQLVSDLDRTQPVYEFRPLEQSLAESIAPRRFNTLLLATFAASALILALAGTFGVVARTVARRTREIGVRIALGARPPEVVRMIVRRAMIWALGGIAVGVPAAIAIGRTMRGLLYGVEPADLTTIALASGGLAVSALAASWLPARRAARVDPMIALREE
jgi:putative ABC transport system permease protein